MAPKLSLNEREERQKTKHQKLHYDEQEYKDVAESEGGEELKETKLRKSDSEQEEESEEESEEEESEEEQKQTVNQKSGSEKDEEEEPEKSEDDEEGVPQKYHLESSESDFDAEKQSPPVAKMPSSKTHQASDDDGDDEESESESESESDSSQEKSRRAELKIKPIATKPMKNPPKKKLSVPTSPTTAKSKKRQAESEPKDSRKKKKKVADLGKEENGGKKADVQKKPFQRLWSEDDEIVILKGMKDYAAKKGAYPVEDMNAFHDFIKKDLHVDVSKKQLKDKIRRLKKKYKNNARKEKNGEVRILLKSHEQETYNLSKKIWVNEGSKIVGIHTTSKVVNGSGTVVVEHNVRSAPKRKVYQFCRRVCDPILEEEILKNGLELIEGPKRVEVEERWKKLSVEEVELYLKRVELIHDQTALVLEAIKSGEN